MSDSPETTVDMHFHVGLLGDKYPQWGRLDPWYQRQLTFKIFLLYAGVPADQLSDEVLRARTLETIAESKLGRVVCLALDPVYDDSGQRRDDRSYIWVDNDYVLDLRGELEDKVLLGASVHPYDPDFEGRVKKYVDEGAVLLKWLPSAQQIDLADPRARAAMEYTATAGRGGRPLPLLLHVGAEYAIPTTNPRTTSYDFLSWSWWDAFWNLLRRPSKRWHSPDTQRIAENLNAAFAAGAVIIFAHCGLPYFSGTLLKRIIEHSDLKTVRGYLERYRGDSNGSGRAYADVSACVTPFRQPFYNRIRELPEGSLLFGSDFPTPVFELSTDLEEAWRDMKEVFKGHFERIIVPQDNLLDVNYRELQNAFPGHRLFHNFEALLPEATS
jgi:predicted TIM-barrel fold metal-dependent hydrolase